MVRRGESLPAVLGLFFLSGFTALLYQVVWLKYLVLVFGNTVYATSTLLSVFMGGLALGSFLFGRIADKVRNPLRLYALLEGLIGLFALFSPFLFKGAVSLYIPIYRLFNGSGVIFGLSRFLLCALILLPPTILMGGTLPLLSRHLVRRGSHLGFRVGVLYGVNTLGAVVGVFLTAFLLILLFGLLRTVILGAVLNLLIFLFAFHLSRGELPPAPPEGKSPVSSASPSPAISPLLSLIVFFSGAVSLSYEVFWTRLLVLHLGSSVYAYALMLGIFLIGLSLGSLIAGRISDRAKHLPLILSFLEFLLAYYLIIQIKQFSHLSSLLGDLGEFFGAPSYGKQMLISALGVGQILIIPTVLIGMVFPIVVKLGTRKWRKVGSSVGILYAWDTLGCILGSLAAGFILIPMMGVDRGMLISASVNLFLGFLLLLVFGRKKFISFLISAGIIIIFFLSYFLFIKPNETVISAGIFSSERGKTLLSFTEDAYATVSVERVEDVRGKWLSLSVNGINVAGTSPDLVSIQKMQGHLPLLLTRSPKRILHIGFGSGGTAYSVSTHDVSRIDIAEISPGVVGAANTYFKGVNHGVLADKRVHLTYIDGRNLVLATKEKYDVILSDSIHPRYAGNGSLYTRDYYLLCRAKLKEHGVISQWLPLYSLREEDFKMILRSFVSVFPHTTVWYINNTINPFTIVIGRMDEGKIDFNLLNRAFSERKVKEDLARIGIVNPYQILDFFIMGEKEVKDYVRDAPYHTDDKPLVEYLASRVINRNLSWYLNFKSIVEHRHSIIPHLTGLPEEIKERENILAKIRRYEEATTYNLKGQLYFLKGDYRQAMAEWEKVRTINPEDLNPIEYFYLGIIRKR